MHFSNSDNSEIDGKTAEIPYSPSQKPAVFYEYHHTSSAIFSIEFGQSIVARWSTASFTYPHIVRLFL